MVKEAKEAWLLREKCGGATLFQRENILTLVQHAGSGTLDALGACETENLQYQASLSCKQDFPCRTHASRALLA
jgi:hypothetical protein